MTTQPILELRSLSKHFGAVKACDRVDLSLAAGEIHALLGENGAGKSTLVKMMFGSLQPDSGAIAWQGQPVRFANPQAARAAGISMVFQHFSLFEALTVAENIALALGDTVPIHRIAHEAAALSKRYRLPVDPHAVVGDLSVGERQRVEIVRCLMQDPRLLILDEPTSVLTPAEADLLFDTLRQMRGEGRSVLYISHRLEEVQRLCQIATIMRGGRVVDRCDPRRETASSLAKRMVGEEVPAVARTKGAPSGRTVLRLNGLEQSANGPFDVALRGINLDVRAGELVCIAGVAGNGQSQLFDAISGERLADRAGMVSMFGFEVGRLSINERRQAGAAFVPEERLGHGAAPDIQLSRNALLSRHASDGDLLRFNPVKAVADGRLKALAARVSEIMDVRKSGPDPAASSLSGGNLQKFLMGRELDRRPELLVVNQPSWGVDAAAAARIHQALLDLTAAGSSLLVISQDLDEVFAIASSICVMNQGSLSAPVPIDEMTRERIGLEMGGLSSGERLAS